MIDAVTLCSATLGEDGKTEPPLGPLYIASVLAEAGVAVDFRDYQLCPAADAFSPDTLAQFLDGHAPVVALSCFVDMLPVVIEAARILHDRRPDTFFLLGGPGPTAAALKIVERYPWIGGVVRGEGEETVREWLASPRRNFTGVRGMVLRRDGVVINGGDRPRTRALDDLPLPAYNLIDWRAYSHARLITTRGCSYRCSFCDVTALWGNRSVFRGLDATLQEIELLRDLYGVTSLAIVDDTFVLNRNRVMAFCNMLTAKRAGIEWGCFGRVNLMTPSLIEAMAESGCRAIFYGIDSGSQRILDKTLKKVHRDTILPTLRRSADAFDKVEASFIWGYPFESYDDFRSTVDLAGEASLLAPTVNVQLHMLSPLPLSPIYREFEGVLEVPEPEDKQWLLLPALLLDDRAAVLRALVREAPEIYPGFYSFPTPDKRRKRLLLERCIRALDRTIGSTLFDEIVGSLLVRDDKRIENQLLRAQRQAWDRIGVGLALGLFRRARRRRAAGTAALPHEHSRGASLVRERNDGGGRSE